MFAVTVGAALTVSAMTFAQTDLRMWVKVGEGLRRTCPSLDCGIVGTFFPGESVVIHESLNGWMRVSDYYSAGCYEGRSSYVESGPNGCTAENGIQDGEFAEWMRAETLSPQEADARG
ncbi:hypothetical protein [Mesorhizobium sp. CAU 1741]|uniref:SH3 domain-containing protein n=1 Tax=Mesorhizobium sp. CAU 1741 TaxID=3140366 RepID=UPI00325AC29D